MLTIFFLKVVYKSRLELNQSINYLMILVLKQKKVDIELLDKRSNITLTSLALKRKQFHELNEHWIRLNS